MAVSNYMLPLIVKLTERIVGEMQRGVFYETGREPSVFTKIEGSTSEIDIRYFNPRMPVVKITIEVEEPNAD